MTSWTRRNAQNMKRSRKAWETRKRMLTARDDLDVIDTAVDEHKIDYKAGVSHDRVERREDSGR